MVKRNLVLIPSVVRNPVLSSFMSEDERLRQLLITIKSCFDKIPNNYIVVMEGGTPNYIDNSLMLGAGADEVFNYDLVENNKRLSQPNRSKSYGEMTLFIEYFASTKFEIIKPDLASISKAGGRIILNEKFKFDETETCVMNYTHKSWSGMGTCNGRYYKIPMSKFEHFKTRLSSLQEDYRNNERIIDIEHGFYQYNVVPLEGLAPEVENGVSLFVSSYGQWEHT